MLASQPPLAAKMPLSVLKAMSGAQLNAGVFPVVLLKHASMVTNGTIKLAAASAHPHSAVVSMLRE